jgi:acetoin utilization protein AcuB
MIIRDIMTTKLVTVTPDDTLIHAANLLRQHQFHHLPVTRTENIAEHKAEYTVRHTLLILEGLLTSQDIELAAAGALQEHASEVLQRPWQEQHVGKFMHSAPLRVTPTTSVGVAAQVLVERGLTSLPVVEDQQNAQETKSILVGLLTRSDLLLALARSMGTFEPGMQVDIPLPLGDMTPLVHTLSIALQLHLPIRSLIAAPLTDGVPTIATLRVGTINPAPFLVCLHEAGITYICSNTGVEGESYV